MFKRTSKIFQFVMLVVMIAAAGVFAWNSDDKAEERTEGMLIAGGDGVQYPPKTITISNRTKYRVEVSLYVAPQGATQNEKYRTKTMGPSQYRKFTTPENNPASGLTGRIQVGEKWFNLIPTNMLCESDGHFTKVYRDSGWKICRISGAEPTVQDNEIGFCMF